MILKLLNFLFTGLNFLIPVVDEVKYVQSLKEIAIGELALLNFFLSFSKVFDLIF